MSVIDYKVRPRLKAKKTLRNETQKVIRSLIITLSTLIVVLVIVFFGLNNDASQKGYTLTQQQLKNEDLRKENSLLTTKVTQATTFESLQQSGKTKQMLETTAKTYVTSKDNAVK